MVATGVFDRNGNHKVRAKHHHESLSRSVFSTFSESAITARLGTFAQGSQRHSEGSKNRKAGSQFDGIHDVTVQGFRQTQTSLIHEKRWYVILTEV